MTDTWSQYINGMAQKESDGVYQKYKESDDFYNGIQWPAPTDKTKHMPRPVLNACKRIPSYKVSSVMSEIYNMVFTPQEVHDDEKLNEVAMMFTKYADTVNNRIGQTDLNQRVLTRAAITGSGYVHYYWDSSIKRGNGKRKYTGGICGEVLDPMNVYLGNPQCNDLSPKKQPYILIPYRDLVSNVKKEAQREVEEGNLQQYEVELITPDQIDDSKEYEAMRHELTNEPKTTVILKYYTEKGKIYWEKSTKGVKFIKERELVGHTCYPIANMIWEEKEGSAEGVGEIENIIPNQKAINFLVSMMLLSAQNTAWSQLVVDDKAIKTNITNTPGAVHRVATNGNSVGNVMAYLNPGSFNNQVFSLLDTLIAYTKDFAGATEDALGERGGSDLNATAIIRLQQAAAIPLESITRNFKKFLRQVAFIWSEFWIYQYEPRILSYDDEKGDKQDFEYNPDNYKEALFDISIDIGTGSKYSEELAMNTLQQLFDKQLISLKQYLEYAPKTVAPFRDRLLKDLEESEMEGDNLVSVIEQLKEMQPEQVQAFLSQDINTIMGYVNQVVGGQNEMRSM